jgi:hypothetical protein
MIENNGTTPAEQDSTTPDPTYDQLIGMVSKAETQAEIMTNTLKGQIEVTNLCEARITDLEASNAHLVNQVSTASQAYAQLEERFKVMKADRDTWYARYYSAKEFIQASLDREEWDTDELSNPFWEELAGMLNLDLKLERDIVVTVTWNLTVKGKADLSSWDFSPSIESDTGSLDIVSGEDHPDIEISE